MKGSERLEGVSPAWIRAPRVVPCPLGLSEAGSILRALGGPEPRRKPLVEPSVSSGLQGRTRFPVCHLPPLQDKESMRRVMQAVDKANGYSFGEQEHRSLEALMSAAVGADFHFSSYPSPPIPCWVELSFLLFGEETAGGGEARVVTSTI